MEPITPLPIPPAAPGNLWTIDEVAAFLRCTVRHVHNLTPAGLPHIYVGRLLRFDPEEVRAYDGTARPSYVNVIGRGPRM